MFNLFKKSLLHQLVGYFSLLSIVSVVLVAVSANVRSREALKHSVIERLNVATAIKESQLNQWIVNQRRDVIWLTQFPDFLVNSEIALMKDRESLESKASIDALRKFMANIPSFKPNLFQISILNNNGITIVSTDKQQEGKYQPLGNTTTYFTRDQSRIIIPNFYISPISGKAAMTFAAPLSNRSGTSIGVVAVDLNLQEVDDIIRLSSGLGTSSETYLVGRLTSENILLSGAVTDKKEIAKDIKSEGITAAALSKDGEGLYRNYKNEPVLGSFLWIDNLNLILMAEISQSEAFEPANRLARDILLIGFSSAGILLTAVYVIARRISQPILAIADAANQVSAGNLNSQAPVLTEDEIGVLAIAFNQMTAQLKSYGEQLLDYSHTLEQKVEQRTHELNQAKEQAEEANKLISALLDKMGNELEKGRQMQLNFLPSELIQLPNWEISAFFKPARQVAGDFYDVFPVLEKHVGLVIADVCDKGVGAALFMALFRSLIRIFSSQTAMRHFHQNTLDSSAKFDELPELTPTNVLEAVALTNNYVAEYHGDLGMFATLFFGVLDPETGVLYYISGGHEPLFIINSEGQIQKKLNSTGPAVGMMPNMKFKVEQAHLNSGDILVGYTDGVVEARATGGEFFTDQRLLNILTKSVPSVNQLLNEITENVINHIGEADQFDDITLIGVQRR